MENKMKRVITYGTFDLLHYGHINLLKRAKALGDYLVVVVSSDEFNWNEKRKKCYFTYEQRKALVEASDTLTWLFLKPAGNRSGMIFMNTILTHL
jgi:cytidyltransferase-related domain